MEFDWKFGKQPLKLNQPSYGFTNTLVLSECNVSVNSLPIVMNSDDLRPGTRALDDRLSHSKSQNLARNVEIALFLSPSLGGPLGSSPSQAHSKSEIRKLSVAVPARGGKRARPFHGRAVNGSRAAR